MTVMMSWLMLDVAFPPVVIGTCPFFKYLTILYPISTTAICFRAKRENCLFFGLAFDIMMFTRLSAGLAATWGLLFLFDLIIFGMTLYRTLTFPRSNNANNLITVFMRDGECRQT